MVFADVIQALQDGKIVSRTEWDKTGEYAVLMPGVPFIWKILTQPAVNVGNWMPPFAEIMADDWKIIDRVPGVAKVIDVATADPA